MVPEPWDMVGPVVWAWIFVGIALGGIVMLVSYAIWLWHKASDLMFEMNRLTEQAEEMATLLSQIDFDRLGQASANRA